MPAQVERADREARAREVRGDVLVAATVLAEPVHERDDRARVALGLPLALEERLHATCVAGSACAAAAARSRFCVTASTTAGTSASTDIPTAHQKVAANASASGSATRARTLSGRRSSVPPPAPPGRRADP